MGAGQTKPDLYKCSFGHVFCHKETKSTLAFYGKDNTYNTSVKITALGARAKLIGNHSNTTCTMKKGAQILTAGIVELSMNEALVVMKADAKIVVKVNGTLNIFKTLLMDEGASLIIEPGAFLNIFGALHIAKGATVRIANGTPRLQSHDIRICVPNFIVNNPFSFIARGPQKDVTWCDEDLVILVGLLRIFTVKWRMDPDIVESMILHELCHRYGVLTTSSLKYKVPRDSHNLVFAKPKQRWPWQKQILT